MKRTALSLDDLMHYQTFLNTDLYLNLGVDRLFCLLRGDREPLHRLSASATAPAELRLGPTYHLNMLQFSDPEQTSAIEAQLNLKRNQALDQRLPADGEAAPAEADMVAMLDSTLLDLWLIETGQVRRVSSLAGQSEMPNVSGAAVLHALGAYSRAVVVAGHLGRATLFYGVEGYFKLLLEAGRLIERLCLRTTVRAVQADLRSLNASLGFDAERYSCLAAMVPEADS
jgi:hypothetical protein